MPSALVHRPAKTDRAPYTLSRDGPLDEPMIDAGAGLPARVRPAGPFRGHRPHRKLLDPLITVGGILAAWLNTR